MASYGFLGALAGTGLGIVSAHTMPATASALTFGGAMGLGASFGLGSIALSLHWDPVSTAGLAMMAGGLTGGLATIVAAPYEFGLFPSLGATLGGILGAVIMGVSVGVVEMAQLLGTNELTFTEGSGWATAGGYLIGGILGGGTALLLPANWDPFLTQRLQLLPPQLGFIPDIKDPKKRSPVALIGASF